MRAANKLGIASLVAASGGDGADKKSSPADPQKGAKSTPVAAMKNACVASLPISPLGCHKVIGAVLTNVSAADADPRCRRPGAVCANNFFRGVRDGCLVCCLPSLRCRSEPGRAATGLRNFLFLWRGEVAAAGEGTGEL